MTENEINEEQVAKYLADHPNFFVSYPELLEIQNIPHETGAAVSLIEHQVKILKGRSETYRKQLEELIDIARENDQLNRQLHRLTLNLIETRTLDEMLYNLQDGIRADFNADVVELKLFANGELEAHAGEPAPSMFQDFISADRPSCGAIEKNQMDFLFADRANEVSSVALVPIKTNAYSGILAIGSTDRQRFHNGQGVDFLMRLGEIVSLSLQSVS